MNFGKHIEVTIIGLEVLRELFNFDLIVEAPIGGLLLGPLHSEGGIKTIRLSNENYVCEYEVEGWEFIMNPFSTTKYLEDLSKINDAGKGQGNSFIQYDIPINTRLINCQQRVVSGQLLPKLLLFGSGTQYVINKASTKRYLKELEEMNKEFEHHFNQS